MDIPGFFGGEFDIYGWGGFNDFQYVVMKYMRVIGVEIIIMRTSSDAVLHQRK